MIVSNHMTPDEIKAHWQDWATKYGTNLRATSKTGTAKTMEIDVLRRHFDQISAERGAAIKALEVGCGNGLNCLGLADIFKEISFTGIDYIGDMIASANILKAEWGVTDDRVKFSVGDVMRLDVPARSFDVIFTDRCLINLNTDQLQHQAIRSLSDKLVPGGYLLMVENSKQTYELQNQARELVGLPKRSPAEFNHFFDEDTLRPFLPTVGLDLVEVEDFISLHDLVLYVLVPMTNGGVVDYDHPMVQAATQLNIALSSAQPSSVGALGQNRLYKCRKI